MGRLADRMDHQHTLAHKPITNIFRDSWYQLVSCSIGGSKWAQGVAARTANGNGARRIQNLANNLITLWFRPMATWLAWLATGTVSRNLIQSTSSEIITRVIASCEDASAAT